MITQKLIIRLLLLSVVLSVALSVLVATGHLLRSMDDLLWGAILLRTALAVGIVWFITLLSLLLAVAVRVVGTGDLSEATPPDVPNEKTRE